RNRLLLERRGALEPDHPIPRAHLAAELRRAGRWKESLETARQAWASWQAAAGRGERHDPVLPATLLAHLALRFERFEEAGRAVAEALESEEHPNFHLLAGIVQERRALAEGTGALALESAARHYERCLELDGRPFASEVMAGATTWQADTRLGSVLLQIAEPERAREVFERALRARGDLREARLGLAEAALEGGRANDAVARLEPLLSEPDPDAWLLSARAALRLGSAADARMLFDRARAARDGQPFVAPHRDRAMTVLERELARLEAAADGGGEATCVFAWPCYDEHEDLEALMGGFGKLLADRPGLVLCLRHDRSIDGNVAGVEARLDRAFSDHLGEGRVLQVMLVDQELESERAVALLAAPGDIVLELPHTRGVRRRFIEGLGARRVDNPAALQRALGSPP
ncbi:MAG: tetratricopeptide repeat protein, partial [Myxococcota bacterium]